MNLYKTNASRIYFILVVFFIPFMSLNAQKAETDSFSLTVTIPSDAMDTVYQAMVFLPENYYLSKDSFPVVYLLHGYTGYYDNWFEREPKLPEYSTRYKMIVVTPEGTSNSWYIDSPVDTTSKFETYIAEEVPGWIDDHFRTLRNKENRAICGLSMGGHGALTIAADHQYRFGAAGSMSGVLDFRPFNKKWNLRQILGKYSEFPGNWYKYSFVFKIPELKNSSLAILIDCGVDDPFYEVNKEVHQELINKNIPHDFFIRPGGHSWDYWKNALPYHLLFFQNYFEKAN